MMKTWTSIGAVMCVAVALCVPMVWAQPTAPQPPARRHAKPAAPGGRHPAARHGRALIRGGRFLANAARDKNLRDMVETVMIAKLSTRLGLNDAQALNLVRSRTKFREDTQRLRKRRVEAAKALDDALKVSPPNKADVNAKLKNLMALDDKIASLRRRGFEDAAKNLSVVQRAQLYLFINEFENDIRQLINRARERGMGMLPPGRVGPPPPPGPRAGLRGKAKGAGHWQGRKGRPPFPPYRGAPRRRPPAPPAPK